MKILITGNAGYIGPTLIKHLRKVYPLALLIGYDSGFYAHCLTGAEYFPEFSLDEQHWGDIRTLPDSFLADIDIIVHLAAISNDPMGSKFSKVTQSINFEASCRLADLAKKNAVKKFIFASSCSMYGNSSGGEKSEVDELNPLSEYAKSKCLVESHLEKISNSEFEATCLRFSTACGMSDRLRLDLVLNDFVASALLTGKISVLSDGTPWRPMIDVGDMAKAIDWAISRDKQAGGNFVALNIGSSSMNHQVKDLAYAVRDYVPGVVVKINNAAPADNRSYKVNFAKYEDLAPNHQPIIELGDTIKGLIKGFKLNTFVSDNFRDSYLIRLNVLNSLINNGLLSTDLVWNKNK